ncbi:ATPase WRNIP1 isoform X1 [Antechinus flavipes]|uniref:ATPase WRNIP1 isoform X1 n=1 Tax=Antechinus flavipes TaxID=38775 RepID=UPI002235FF7E|nr:ATPase WRNIP1 isoform X1 [Antechinus flavipes]
MEVSGPEDDPFLSQLHQVQCPVCQQALPAAHINAHLDRCLLLHPAGLSEPDDDESLGSAEPGRRPSSPPPPPPPPGSCKRRRLSGGSLRLPPATPTGESSDGEAEEPDEPGPPDGRDPYDRCPSPCAGAHGIPAFARGPAGSPLPLRRKVSGKRPVAAAASASATASSSAATVSASPRCWKESERSEDDEDEDDDEEVAAAAAAAAAAMGDEDDDEEDQEDWEASAPSTAAFRESAGHLGPGRAQPRPPAREEIWQKLVGKPLADKMRPATLQEYIGQNKVVGQETLLRSLLESNEIPSLILWGPPGCGKTTLAYIIANNSKKNSMRFVTLSATSAKTSDVRDVIKQAQNEKNFFKRKTILFIDEIHRFNKSQQDTFLPHVECGTVTLIGATTENPSFQVNAALLSRCRVIVLEKLSAEAMKTILMRAVSSLGLRVLDQGRPTDSVSHGNSSSCSSSSSENCGSTYWVRNRPPIFEKCQLSGTQCLMPPVYIEDKAVNTLAYLCDGDARTGLNGLQLAVQAKLGSRKPFCKKSVQNYSGEGVLITENDVKEGLQRSHILYDRAGEEHYNCISALHKSMRGSDQNASLYWLARMLEGGEDPLYVARRLVRFASEDIGLADPSALTQAVAAYQGCHFIGMPECEVLLAQCVVYFARAPKSIEVYNAYNNVKACLRNHQGPLPPVPMHLRNAPTRLMKDLGYGKGYKYNPSYKDPVEQEYLPEELRGIDFFKQKRC